MLNTLLLPVVSQGAILYSSTELMDKTRLNKNVHNPEHYNCLPNGLECIHVTQHFDFLIGNAIKYSWRAGKKDKAKEVEDLEKAIWYIKQKIAQVEGRQGGGE